MSEDAFITVPNIKAKFKTHLQPQTVPKTLKKELPNSLKEKIIYMIDKLKENKSILNQAIQNLNIPRIFIDATYINQKPQQQLDKIYFAVNNLKKEVQKLMRNSSKNVIQCCRPNKNNYYLQKEAGSKNNVQNLNNKPKKYMFLKKYITPEEQIKKQIECELKLRKKLAIAEQKIIKSDQIRKEILQKKIKSAKLLNKKALEVYQRQKEQRQEFFEKIFKQKQDQNKPQQTQHIKTKLLPQAIKKLTQSEAKDDFDMLSVNQNGQNREKESLIKRLKRRYELTKANIDRQKQLQNANLNILIGQVQHQSQFREAIIHQFRNNRQNSLNERSLQHQNKTSQVRLRKMMTQKQSEQTKLKKLIKKEQQIQARRYNKFAGSWCKNTITGGSDDENLRSTSNFAKTRQSKFQKTFIECFDQQKEWQQMKEKQEKIIKQLGLKKQRKQQLLQDRINTLREKHIKQEQKRLQHKERLKMARQAELKSLQEQKENQKAQSQINTKMKQNKQQQIIRQNYKNAQERQFNQGRTIGKLKKLSTSTLQQHLKDLKNKQLNDLLAKNIVQFLK